MAVSTRKRPATDPYAAPALEKGLDILELLADAPAGLTQAQIADRLGRSHTEIFRMLLCLQRRGYLSRTSPGDAFALSAKLFELSHRHPPTRALLELASPVLQEIAQALEQSCHLSIAYQDQILVVANADSPGPRSLSVRVGTRFDMAATASGVVLMAWKESSDRIDAELRGKLDRARRRGFEQHHSRSIRGVIDLSCPVRDASSDVVAAITVPYLTRRGERSSAIDAARETLLAEAAKLSALLGYSENHHE
jgi:DNA-binding IclR family transcriptional regulator